MVAYRLNFAVSASAEREDITCPLYVIILVASDWQNNLLLAMIFPGLLLQEYGSRNISHGKMLTVTEMG